MRSSGLPRLAGIALAAWVAAASLAEGRAAQEPDETEREERAGSDVITPLLEKRLEGKTSLDDVVLDVRWPFEDRYTSARVFGNGIGIWQRELQIRLPRAETRRLIQLLVTTRFGSLPQSFGSEEGRTEQSLKGRVVVWVGPVRKAVSQSETGAQSPVLQKIAEQVLAASKKASAHGVGVSSFADGFQKLSAGTLASEAFALDLRRRVSAVGGEGWLLRLNGRRALAENLPKNGIASSAHVLVLSAKDFGALVQALREADPPALPLNLYAAEYTDVLVQLLNKSRHVQARQFSGMTAQSHGEKQAAFDRLLGTLAALHARVEREGRIVEIPDQLQAEAEERERERKEEKRQRERESGPDGDPDSPKASPTPASPGKP